MRNKDLEKYITDLGGTFEFKNGKYEFEIDEEYAPFLARKLDEIAINVTGKMSKKAKICFIIMIIIFISEIICAIKLF